MADYLPGPDAQYNDWGQNFSTVCTANAVALGLSAGELTEISGASSDFDNAYVTSETAKNAARGAVAMKDEARVETTEVYRRYARQFLADPSLPLSLLADLGLNVGSGGAGPVSVPTELSAVGYDNGENKLRWNRNGNVATTIFVVEARIGNEGEWFFVDVTTKTRFTHDGQTPGTEVFYRVYAQRAGSQSGYSNIAVVYSDGGDAALSVAA